MRVGHVLPVEVPVTYQRGGAVQRRVRELSRAQSALGHDVIIFSPREPNPLALAEQGVHIEPVPLSLPRPWADYEYLARVARKIRSMNVDIVHAHAAPEAARVLRSHCHSVVQTVDFFRYRMTGSAVGRAHYRRSLNMHDAVLPVSRYCRDGVQGFYGPLSCEVEVVYNGVDLEGFKDTPARRSQAAQELNLPTEPYVLYVGRVNEQKGSDMLPGLARVLSAAGARLVVAGPGQQFGSAGRTPLMEQLVASGALVLGAVREQALPGLMAAAELLVLPTRNAEMFGMVLVEAGAAGTPAVASDLGGIPEALGDGGVMFTPGDESAMTQAVLSLLGAPDELAALSDKALQNARRFAWPLIAGQYLKVYESG